jgi:hypothetical protein
MSLEDGTHRSIDRRRCLCGWSGRYRRGNESPCGNVRTKRTKSAPFPRTNILRWEVVETNSCRCLREPASARVPTPSFKFRGQPADLSRDWTETVGLQFPNKNALKAL